MERAKATPGSCAPSHLRRLTGLLNYAQAMLRAAPRDRSMGRSASPLASARPAGVAVGFGSRPGSPRREARVTEVGRHALQSKAAVAVV